MSRMSRTRGIQGLGCMSLDCGTHGVERAHLQRHLALEPTVGAPARRAANATVQKKLKERLQLAGRTEGKKASLSALYHVLVQCTRRLYFCSRAACDLCAFLRSRFAPFLAVANHPTVCRYNTSYTGIRGTRIVVESRHTSVEWVRSKDETLGGFEFYIKKDV